MSWKMSIKQTKEVDLLGTEDEKLMELVKDHVQ
jgi:hypothetical protein